MLDTKKTVLGIAVLAALAGCDAPTGSATVGGGTKFLAEQRCSEAVAVMTNPDVRVESSTLLASGEYEVIMSVFVADRPRAPWRCLGAPDGSTRAVEFIGTEGAA